MIDVLGSSYPRISSQAYRAVFEEPEQEEVAPSNVTIEPAEVETFETPPQPLNAEHAKLVEVVAQLRQLDVQGIYSGGSKEEWGAPALDLPYDIRCVKSVRQSADFKPGKAEPMATWPL